jgi:hypothetical protein
MCGDAERVFRPLEMEAKIQVGTKAGWNSQTHDALYGRQGGLEPPLPKERALRHARQPVPPLRHIVDCDRTHRITKGRNPNGDNERYP